MSFVNTINELIDRDNNVIFEELLKQKFEASELPEIYAYLEERNDIQVISNYIFDDNDYDDTDPAVRSSLQLYLNSISQYPLLSHEEEIELGKRIQEGDEEAKQQMIKSNLRLVVSIAKQYHYDNIPLLDLIQEGSIGLMKAVDKYDYTTGYRFSTCASWWIKQSIGKYIETQLYLLKVPSHVTYLAKLIKTTSQELNTKLNREPTLEELAAETNINQEKIIEYLLATNEIVPLDNNVTQVCVDQYDLDQENMRKMIEQVLSTLKPNEQKVVAARFGLESAVPKTLEEIGQKFNISKERVRQIETTALRKLRNPVRANILAKYV